MEDYSIYFIYSTSVSDSVIAGIMSNDLDGLWASIREQEDLC